MIKHFCDACEEELDDQRINRNNLVIPIDGKSVAIAMQVDGIDEPSICPACLFWWASYARDKFFKIGEFAEIEEISQDDVDAMLTDGIIESSKAVLELKIKPEEQKENGGTHNEGKSTA